MIADIYKYEVGSIYRQISKRYSRDSLSDRNKLFYLQSHYKEFTSVLAYKHGLDFVYRQ